MRISADAQAAPSTPTTPPPSATAAAGTGEVARPAPSRPFSPASIKRTTIAPGAPGYESQRAQDKQAALYGQIAASPYATLPALDSGGLQGGSTVWQKVGNFLRAFKFPTLEKTFDNTADVRPTTTDKLFHPFGVAATVQFEPVANSPYTGIFKSGAPGIARLSLATAGNYAPGLGLKLLVDGQASKNVFALHSLEGEPTHDFFAPTLSTELGKPKSLAARFLVWVTSLVANPLKRPVDHLSKVSTNGAAVANAASPARLNFVPSAAVRGQADDPKQDFRTELMALTPGTTLYDVYGADDDNAKQVLVGHLRLTSPLVASQFEDRALFFKHER